MSRKKLKLTISMLMLLNTDNELKKLEFGTKFTLVSFFAVDCGPCIRELKAIDSKSKDWKEKYEIQILGVANRNAVKSAKSLQKFKNRFNYSIALYIDINNTLTNSLYENYQNKEERCFIEYKKENYVSTPQIFIFDKMGSIVFHKKGFKDGDENMIERFLNLNK